MSVWKCLFGESGEANFSEKDWNDAKEHLKGKEQEGEKELDPLEGVGEPIISFVKLLEEQPERFLWKENWERDYVSGFCTKKYYKLIDKVHRRVYLYYIFNLRGTRSVSRKYLQVEGIYFLNEYERAFLYEVHSKYLGKRFEDNMRELNKREADQRQEYINIYCKEG